MKPRSIIILCLLLTMFFSFATTAAAFQSNKTVFAILDKTGNVDSTTANEWREQITGSFKFPFFEVEKNIIMLNPKTTTIGNDPKSFASKLAQANDAKLIFIMEVNTFEEWVLTNFGYGDYGDDIVRSNISINVIIYDVVNDKFLAKKIRNFSEQSVPIAEGILKTSKYAFLDIVYNFVGQKDINKDGEKSE